MKFEISCSTFVRLANAAMRPEREVKLAWQPSMMCVRIEHRNGQTFGVATDSFAVAAELLGETTEPNGFVHITIDDKMLNACSAAIENDGVLTVVLVDKWAVATIAETSFMYPGNASIGSDDWPKDWRVMLIDVDAERNRGALAVNGSTFSRLVAASPSGIVVFSKIIDTERYLILNDAYDPDWIGIFRCTVDDNDERPFKHATVRDWAK